MVKIKIVLITILLFAGISYAETRVVSLGSVVTETLQALDATDSLVAVDASSELSDEQSSLPRVGYYRMVSTEGVLSTRPDLVLGTEDAGPPHVIKQLRQAGVDVELVTAEKSLEGAVTRIVDIGKKVGKQEQALALAQPLKERAENPVEVLPSAPKVLFLYARGAGAPMVSGTKTGAAEMIRLAGAENSVAGFEGYRPLTAESLVASKPEVILVTTNGLEAMGGKDGVWSLPGMSHTPAGKEKKIVVMEDTFLLNFGPRTVDAVDQLRSRLTE